MRIQAYDRVLLNTGYLASIVEIFGDKTFLADIDKHGDTYTEEIALEDILCVLGQKESFDVKADEMLRVYETQIEDMLYVFEGRLKELRNSTNAKSDFERGRELAYQEVIETIRTRHGIIWDVISDD